MTWLTIATLAVCTYALRLAGLVANRLPLPVALRELLDVLPAPLLAALVVVQAVDTPQGPTLDARLVGLLAAGLVLWRGGSLAVVVVVAAGATAIARALGMP